MVHWKSGNPVDNRIIDAWEDKKVPFIIRARKENLQRCKNKWKKS